MRRWVVPTMLELAKLGLFFAAGAALLMGMLAFR